MPSIAFIRKDTLPSDNMSIDISVTHNIVLGQPSPSVRTIKRWTTPEMEMTLDSGFSITMSGSLNEARVSEELLSQSAPFHRLQEYLDRHAQELGFDAAFIDTSESSCIKLNQSIQDASQSPRRLTNLSIHCAWKVSNQAMDPFSHLPFLPFESLYASALETLISTNFVRQYPLIFGPLQSTIANDLPAFASAAQSLSKILQRASSDNSKACLKSIKAIRRNLRFQHRARAEQTQHCLGTIELDDPDVFEYDEPEVPKDVIAVALRRFAEMTLPVSLAKKRRVPVAVEKGDIFASEDEEVDHSQEQEPTKELLMFDDLCDASPDNQAPGPVLCSFDPDNDDNSEEMGLGLSDSTSPLDPDIDGTMLFSSASENDASDSSMILDPHELYDCIDSSAVQALWHFPMAPYADEALSQRMFDYASSFNGLNSSDGSQHRALFDSDSDPDEISPLAAASAMEEFDALSEEQELCWGHSHADLISGPKIDVDMYEDGWLDW